jgi:hypothetical protein
MLQPGRVKTVHRQSRLKLVLVLGSGAPDSDGLLAGLQAHAGFRVLRAIDSGVAEMLLRESPIALALAWRDAAVEEIESLVAAIRRSRLEIPVLAIRAARSSDAGHWEQLGVAVLREPLLPDALVRSVEVVLGLRKKS